MYLLRFFPFYDEVCLGYPVQECCVFALLGRVVTGGLQQWRYGCIPMFLIFWFLPVARIEPIRKFSFSALFAYAEMQNGSLWSPIAKRLSCGWTCTLNVSTKVTCKDSPKTTAGSSELEMLNSFILKMNNLEFTSSGSVFFTDTSSSR